MPKEKQPLRFKLEKYRFFSAYEKSISTEKRFLISQHVCTSKHKQNITRKNKFKQQFFTDAVANNSQSSTFSKELCEAMISADIPLWKLNHFPFKQFMEKHSGKRISVESTLRKNYLSVIYENCLASIREYINDGPICITIDETTDSKKLQILKTGAFAV
ncbi:unnamed protein product [Parnassius mnemosyne]|uniref:Transposase n=1 Tax=Parnassius mnemosyne TaxID=213953 RepID=A0AAV1LAZ0_9NEOP